ncbi:hypothetical protein CI109_100652 [Kwoniella shandongensis]|uniref:UDP-N-acetylglucosamine transferase subunit ALG13 n=1 Tax=Kwoniella shandongensis TaxID=1734106 RepID=A0A5M6BZ36_9TREE|nr:uncharacterized protein CI109_003426 [Kwoniella shandongensis]KAA5528138.1 hypothetical protein CI109_003426 [Kwoniella shandongensis]
MTLSSLLVTVGSTLFPALTNTILSPPLLAKLSSLGIKQLIVQYGRADLPPDLGIGVDSKGSGIKYIDGMVVQVMRFSEKFEELVKKSDAVISHAGSGSILTTLRRNPPIPLLVVPNETLMDNHQAELADEMSKQGYLMVSRVEELEEKLSTFLEDKRTEAMKPFPEMDGTRFRGIVDEMMGFA